jgi:hypothetical protein
MQVDVEGGEASVVRGMQQLLDGAPDEIEIVLEITPKWLKLQSSSGAQLLGSMASRGFHAYALSEEYELGKCVPLPPPARPRRLRQEEGLDGHEQLDVIFSRTDATWL